ncbi:unnamed protein product, partial [Iphiclides podalirius]
MYAGKANERPGCLVHNMRKSVDNWRLLAALIDSRTTGFVAAPHSATPNVAFLGRRLEPITGHETPRNGVGPSHSTFP